ncbi:SET domain-containing protein [Cylindrobasidium torrendii FP15055 ss-10]|uniref:SET domain-containing protein n=1 Tax=Cylindrobasidium torrendii FP15055 ss-10 TaxID=1314674 RepID=A0A0D7BUK3_9AGAR|nr:SET domain-containing protein [Cylindrobasidium torrendii FP15055 ss-10]
MQASVDLENMSQVMERATTIFAAVLEEFTAWDAEDSRLSLKSLKSARTTQNATRYVLPWNRPNAIEQDPKELVINVIEPFSSAALYESSPLADRNIFKGDDASSLAAIPFLDDKTFDWRSFASEYDAFDWDDMARHNPNWDLVCLTAACRMHRELGLSFQEIDKLDVLPLRIHRHSPEKVNGKGKRMANRERDFPNWPALELPAEDPVAEADRRAAMVGEFCNCPNCLTFLCPTHIYTTGVPMKKRARLRSGELKDICGGGPCGTDCFITFTNDEATQAATMWKEDDLLALKYVLEEMPDESPCTLAVICQMPCRQVYAKRRELISDDTIFNEPPKPKARRTRLVNTKREIQMRDTTQWSPNAPCYHPGRSCMEASTASCICLKEDVQCQEACRCEQDVCPRRAKGCSCQDQCEIGQCPCRKSGRECDPYLCTACNARDYHATNACKNTSIQKNIWKDLLVKKATYGRGVFALCDMKKDEYIIEYIGELIRDTTLEGREVLATHRGRNYLFQLNKEYTIDATFVGNEARYINHAPGRTANCFARILLVNGEHRIGFWASRDIKAGEEVLLDYGENFFQDKLHSSQLTAKVATKHA